MAKKLSLRPLRRIVKFQVELGPYSVSFRDGMARTPRYVLWISEVPKGKRSHRFMAVVQAVYRLGNLADEIHNPVLFRKVVILPNNQDSELKAKWCYRCAQKAMYFLIKQALEKATRPMLRSCGDDIIAGKTCGDEPPYWHNWEPGFMTDTLGEYRKTVLSTLANKYLGQWEESQ